ncbi:putative glycosyltransferase EpsE [Flavobacterium sp. ACN2]|jgi:glycosyltransferase involved in cell wall biosynthesis|uniref:glycosyltransferase family 2 protein n=1 Tax=unclassified Flavobacterium TaxID=196869 RepID=UPI000BB2D22E|nr:MULTISPECIES: glycosyltransferase family 2 protein [unclassified Flavobacterium]MDY0987393.1 glycosyltransferase family 2 protein [Flavobacterium sp. CFBP9031]PBI84156.1 putative glycosyltransferase EpsE [Flavobacterium sp. ACN2]
MSTKPLISVVILCYNQEATIARTIESVLQQETNYSFEIIIGEDASPNDNTRLICKQYAEKYPDIIHLMDKQPNKGLLKNYIDCIQKSRGRYLGVCAGDDWWHNPHKLEMQVQFLEKDNSFGLVFTDYRIVNVNNNVEVFTSSKPIIVDEKKMYLNLLKGNFISAGTVIFRKEIFSKYINFDKFISLGFVMEDYPMWLEMIQHTKFKYIPVETITYTVAEGSLSNNKSNYEKTEKFENAVFDIKKHFLSKYSTNDITVKKLQELHHNFLATNFIKEGHFERAKYHSNFLVRTGLKGFVKFLICNTPFVKLYSNYLNKS